MKKIFLIAGLLLVRGLFADVHSQQWFYADPINPLDSISIQSAPSTFGINDVSFEAIICDKYSKYICIEAPGFSFYVPRNFSSGSSSS